MNEKVEIKGSLISYFSSLVKLHGGINLAQGVPGFKPPEELILLLKDYASGDYHQYAPAFGHAGLLELLVQHYQPFSNNTLSSDDFLITQGATEAIALIFIYLLRKNKGQLRVLAFEPVYESYRELPGIFHNSFTSFPLINYQTIDFEKLEETIKSRNINLIFVSSPGNPLGKIWSKKETEQLIKLTEQYSINIIWDAVYEDLCWSQTPFNPLRLDYPNIFYVNSFSKMLSITGWRIGYLHTSQTHLTEIKDIHDYIGLCAPTLQQVVLYHYLKEYSWGKEYVQNLRQQLKNAYQIAFDALKKMGFNPVPVDGGYFIWARLPEPFEDGVHFCLQLYKKTGVALVPGIHFTSSGQKWIRLNFATSLTILEDAFLRIKNFLGQ